MATANKGRLYLIPSPLGENNPSEVIPSFVLDTVRHIDRYVVEEVRTARRYLSKAGLKGQIDTLEFVTLNEHSPAEDVEAMASLFDDGHDVGLISEAGLPAVADPGALLVALCHRIGVEVMPLVGPSSLMMALMASGLNGQSFAFRGYLPAKTDERRSAIRAIEKNSANCKQTQIFIETPYRNDQMFADLLQTCAPGTLICLAVNITMPDQFIRTMNTAQWKKNPIVIGKRPCVFLISAQQ